MDPLLNRGERSLKKRGCYAFMLFVCSGVLFSALVVKLRAGYVESDVQKDREPISLTGFTRFTKWDTKNGFKKDAGTLFGYGKKLVKSLLPSAEDAVAWVEGKGASANWGQHMLTAAHGAVDACASVAKLVPVVGSVCSICGPIAYGFPVAESMLGLHENSGGGGGGGGEHGHGEDPKKREDPKKPINDAFKRFRDEGEKVKRQLQQGEMHLEKQDEKILEGETELKNLLLRGVHQITNDLNSFEGEYRQDQFRKYQMTAKEVAIVYRDIHGVFDDLTYDNFADLSFKLDHANLASKMDKWKSTFGTEGVSDLMRKLVEPDLKGIAKDWVTVLKMSGFVPTVIAQLHFLQSVYCSSKIPETGHLVCTPQEVKDDMKDLADTLKYFKQLIQEYCLVPLSQMSPWSTTWKEQCMVKGRHTQSEICTLEGTCTPTPAPAPAPSPANVPAPAPACEGCKCSTSCFKPGSGQVQIRCVGCQVLSITYADGTTKYSPEPGQTCSQAMLDGASRRVCNSMLVDLVGEKNLTQVLETIALPEEKIAARTESMASGFAAVCLSASAVLALLFYRSRTVSEPQHLLG